MFTSIDDYSISNNGNSYYYYCTNTDHDQHQHQQYMLDKTFTNDVSPNFKHDHHHHHTPLSSNFQFSSAHAASNNEDDAQLFQQQKDLIMFHLNHRMLAETGAKTNKVVDVNAPIDPSFANDHNKRNDQADQTPRKRSSKKDRHSKIITAQGPRDRRMRLSLPVARKFFPLQDMLGFDKASKTVDWLMKHADSEITKLYRGVAQAKPSCTRSEKSVSSTSECDAVSGIYEINHQESILDEKAPASIAKESKKVRRKPVFNPHAKESRAMARARARERTMEKKWSWSQHPCLQGLKHLTSSSSFEKGEESNSHCHDLKYSSDQVTNMENISHQRPMNDIVEEDSFSKDSFSITNKANQSSIFDYNHEIAISHGVSSSNFNFPNYLGNSETNLASHFLKSFYD